MAMPGAARSLKARALQWLAQREQSRVELRRKLLPHALAEVEADELVAAERVDALLDWLAEHNYLSSARFAESRVRARSARYGNLRIRQELKQHQVALDPATAQALKESELQRAMDLLARRFAAPPANLAERAKQARFLSGRGFSPEVIARALRRGGAGRHATFDG